MSSEGPFDASTDLITLACDAAVDAQRWPEVMARLQALVKSQAAAVVSYDVATKSGCIRYAAGIAPEFQRSYSVVAAHDPWLGSGKRAFEPGAPRIGGEPESKPRPTRNRFFRDWLKPQKLYHGMYAALSTGGKTGAACVLMRTRAAGPFGGDELAAFEAVLPELRQAWGTHEWLSSQRARNEAVLSLLDRLPIGVVLVAPGCRVIEVNERARQIIALEDGPRIDGDILRTASQSETARLHRLVATATAPQDRMAETAEDVLALSRPSGRAPFSALVSPLASGAYPPGEGVPLAAILLSEPHRQQDIDPVRLERLYRLTPAEAQLAVLLAQGRHLEDAAERLHVSLNAARTRVKRIHKKTGTNRLADLVRVILSDVAVLGTPASQGARPSPSGRRA